MSMCETCLREELADWGSTHHTAMAPTQRVAHGLAGMRGWLAVDQPMAMQDMLKRVALRRALLPRDADERLHCMRLRDLCAVRARPFDSMHCRFRLALLGHLDPLTDHAPLDHFDSRMIWPDIASHRPKALLGARLLVVRGSWGATGADWNLIPYELQDWSRLLGALPTASRDFH